MLPVHDHRQIGQSLDLFHLQEEAPGRVFWHPRGHVLLGILRASLARVAKSDGFEEVQTPQILRKDVWIKSGHFEHFRSGMFSVGGDERPAFAKPVSCPGHLELFRRCAASYRDLPLRFAEFGVVHRNEPSGTLHGLFRLREFTQDDGHVFCSEEQIEPEVARFAASLVRCYSAFGFGSIHCALATRPSERAGCDKTWDEAERRLERAAVAAQLDFQEAPGAGAFYGPKLEFSLSDHAGRSWQCGTIQLDLVLPERFDVTYVNSRSERRRPALLHRAVLGSLERFLGILLEHYAGKLPLWLAPEQVAILPVGEADHDAAQRFERRLARCGVRTRVDTRPESLSRRVLSAHERVTPFLAILGERERLTDSVALRSSAEQHLLPADQAILQLARLAASPFDAI